MAWPLALVAPLVLASAGSVPADPLPTQMVCVGQAEGAGGETVTVFIHVQPDRSRAAAYASWSPPLASASGIGASDQPDLAFLLGYDAVSIAGVGQPSEYGQILVTAFSPLRDRIPSARLQARLSVLHAEARFDDAAPLSIGFNQPGPAHHDLPGTAARNASFSLPASMPGKIEITLRDSKGKPVVTHRYTTDNLSSRDALFTKAYSEAATKAEDPTGCEPTTGPDAIYAGAASDLPD